MKNVGGTARREGAIASMSISRPSDESDFYSCKLKFECKNNMVEYEALFLGLEFFKA